MSNQYENVIVGAKCMNERNGSCGAVNCKCEDYNPIHAMSQDEIETILPGVRDRSFNPGFVHYRSQHTRLAGEHRYPREDIVVNTDGTKRYGGYDDPL